MRIEKIAFENSKAERVFATAVKVLTFGAACAGFITGAAGVGV